LKTEDSPPSAPHDANLELTAERWFPVAVERVWEQCTSKRGLERWWSPEDLRTSARRFDPRPGGDVVLSLRYASAMLDPKNEETFRAAGVPISLVLRGKIREWQKHRRLVLELTLTLDRAGAGITTVTQLEFEATGGGTRLRLTVTGKSDPHFRTLGEANLNGQLDRLGQSLVDPPASSP